MVMTDWWSVYNAEKLMTSGVDIEMPKADVLAPGKVRQMLESGLITEAVLDKRVECILRPCIEMGLLDIPHTEPEMRARWGEHRKVAEQIAREGLVLLKNSDNLLPLNRNQIKDVVLYGVNASKTVATGGGAAGFYPGDAFVTYEQAVKKAAGETVKVTAIDAIDRNRIKQADAVIVFLTMNEHEAMDRNFEFDENSRFALQMISRLNRNVIAVVSLGGGAEMASWEADVNSLIYAWYPGTYGATALGEIIFGDVNPSGKLPISIEKRVEDTHYHGNFLPDNTVLPRTFPGWMDKDDSIHDVIYREGIFTGYRWYDSRAIEPLFPFGFGLSYTSFEIGEPKLSSTKMKSGESLSITVEVTNTGDRAGAEVVQLYLSDPEARVPRPEKELKGFQRIYLSPGEIKPVTLTLTERDLSFWDPGIKGWYAEEGTFQVRIGTSSRHLPRIAEFRFIR